MSHNAGPFAIPAIHNFVPERLKPYVMILLVIIFQFSGGVYLATANEMVGSTSLMQEDILMAGYASLIGTAMTFAVMLRLKMYFTSKVSLLTTLIVLIICNLIALTTHNLPILIATCFIAGVFRMWGTFECNSTIQLWLTPTRDLSVFFCYIYLLVQGAILLSGSTDLYVALFSNWHYIHWMVIGLLLVAMLVVMLLFNNTRFKPAFPLFGIDWLGAFLWSLVLLCINFISLYGEHYDWWYSDEIRTATVFLLVLLVLNIYRASFIRHPFIALPAFKYKAVYATLLLYLIVDVFIAPANLVEHIYFEHILHYEAQQIITVNWFGWLGVAAGAGFSYVFFARKKHSYKSTFLIGFFAIMVYLVMMYFMVDKQTTQEMLFAPVFLRNFGYVIIAIVLLTNLTKVPFHHFFQAVSIQAFVSAAVGSAIGGAFLQQLFEKISSKNFQLISADADRVNPFFSRIGQSQLTEMIQQQVLLVSFKELYGWLVIAGILCCGGFLLYQYPYAPIKALYPKMRSIRKMLKKEIA